MIRIRINLFPTQADVNPALARIVRGKGSISNSFVNKFMHCYGKSEVLCNGYISVGKQCVHVYFTSKEFLYLFKSLV